MVYQVFISKLCAESVQQNIHSAEVSQFAVISFSPGENLPVHSQGHGVSSPRMHSNLLHHIVTECSNLTGDWDGPAGEAQAQPAVGGLSTGVDLSLHCHCNSNVMVKHNVCACQIKNINYKHIYY